MTNKELYRIFCEEHQADLPIYSQYWWMEAVCAGKQWDVIIVRNKAHKIVATLPYLIGHKWRFSYILMPPLTQTNGPHLLYPDGQTQRERLTYEKDLCYDLINQIGHLDIDYYQQNFEPQLTNWLPFCWKHYQQTTRYTYRIDDTSNLESVFAQFTPAKQRQIRKGIRNGLECQQNALSAEDFYKFHCQILTLKGEKDSTPQVVETGICREAIKREQGVLLSINAPGNPDIQSALLMVWDGQTAYYLIPANHPGYKETGASSLIIWRAIQLAHRKSLRFDFEGSMQESIENSYNQFGTTQVPYMQITKASSFIAKLWEMSKIMFR